MWPLLKRQERPVSGGFIFITLWNSLGHVKKVMNSVVGIHEVFCVQRIEDGIPCSQGKYCMHDISLEKLIGDARVKCECVQQFFYFLKVRYLFY